MKQNIGQKEINEFIEDTILGAVVFPLIHLGQVVRLLWHKHTYI